MSFLEHPITATINNFTVAEQTSSETSANSATNLQWFWYMSLDLADSCYLCSNYTQSTVCNIVSEQNKPRLVL